MHNSFLPTVTFVNSGGSPSPVQVIFPPYGLQLRVAKLHHPCTTFPFPVQCTQYGGNCAGFPHHVERNSERNCLWTRCKHSGQIEVTFGFTKCNVYTICRQKQISTRCYANLLNVNLNNYMRCKHSGQIEVTFGFTKCNVYTICRHIQLSTRCYANLLNVNLNNYMFRPQCLAIFRLYKRKLIN